MANTGVLFKLVHLRNPQEATSGGLQVGSTLPTGMLSCFTTVMTFFYVIKFQLFENVMFSVDA